MRKMSTKQTVDNEQLEGQMNIFDFLSDPNPEKKDIPDNVIINQLIQDLRYLYPRKVQDVEYKVWDHVPNLGKRLWLCLDDVGDEYDLSEVIDKYMAFNLEISVSPVPHFDKDADFKGYDLFVSTMWTTKNHKESECTDDEISQISDQTKPKCTKAAECEAYPDGCRGSIEPCRWNGPMKWPKQVIIKGLMDDGYCPECDANLDDLIDKCPYCGTKVLWDHWKILNEV